MLRTDAQDRVFYRVAEPGQRRGTSPATRTCRRRRPAWPRRAGLLRRRLQGPGGAHRRAAPHAAGRRGRARQLLVQVAETLDARHQLTHRLVLQSAPVQLVLIAPAAGLIVLRRAPRPGAAEAAARRGARARPRRPEADRHRASVPREVAPLIEAINVHTERQRQLGEAQLRFVANASHQLKTPLTLLRAQVGQALLQTDVGAVRAVLARLDETTDATARLVGQLLSAGAQRARPRAARRDRRPGRAGARRDLRAARRGARQAHRPRLRGPWRAAGARRPGAAARAGDQPGAQRDRPTRPTGGRVTVAVGRRDGRPLAAAWSTTARASRPPSASVCSSASTASPAAQAPRQRARAGDRQGDLRAARHHDRARRRPWRRAGPERGAGLAGALSAGAASA